MRLSAMGDVAMTVPVLRAFTYKYPEVDVTVISRPFFKPLFDVIPNVSFFSFDNKRHKGFFGLLTLFRDLKALNINVFADLHNVLRSKIIRNLFALHGKKTKSVDKGRAEKKALTRTSDKIFKQLPTMFERHLAVFSALGFPMNGAAPVMCPKINLSPEVEKLTGTKDQTWIGIAPFAQYESKVYPLDLLQIVIDGLADNPNYKIFLFGGNKDIDAINSLSNTKENVINAAGKMSFEHELQLISNLDIMLSMDSGNAHLAAMYGIKVVTLWGATHPFSGFSPAGQPQENALVSDREQFPKLPTSVYGNVKVAGYENAMRTIPPQIVIEKIEQLLKSN